MLDTDLGGRGGGLFFSPLNMTICYVPWAPLEWFYEAADIACNICKKWAAFLYTRTGVILTALPPLFLNIYEEPQVQFNLGTSGRVLL